MPRGVVRAAGRTRALDELITALLKPLDIAREGGFLSLKQIGRAELIFAQIFFNPRDCLSSIRRLPSAKPADP